jgi:hypothetical protein
MPMAEGSGNGKLEWRQMWQWTAALTAGVALDLGDIVGCRRRRRTVMVTEGGCR